MTDNRVNRILHLFSSGDGILRSSFLRQHGVCSKDIRKLLERNIIVRLKDGYYARTDMMDHISDYQVVVATVPDAVICGISAASLHDLTTVIPDAIHIAVPNKGKLPTMPDFPSVEIIQSKKSLYEIGITKLDGLPIYDRERTVCDCIKASDSIGTDVAIEILRTYMNGKRDIQKLYDYASRLRIAAKLHPYMEVLA